MKQVHQGNYLLKHTGLVCGKEFYQNSHFLAKGDCSRCRVQQCRDRVEIR